MKEKLLRWLINLFLAAALGGTASGCGYMASGAVPHEGLCGKKQQHGTCHQSRKRHLCESL